MLYLLTLGVGAAFGALALLLYILISLRRLM